MSKVKKTYSIHLTRPVALSLAGLGALCMILAFYMGVVTGKGLRTSNEEIPVAASVPSGGSVPSTQLAGKPKPTDAELKFFNLADPEPTPDALNLPRIDRLKAKTSELTRNLAAKPVTAKSASTTNLQAKQAKDRALKALKALPRIPARVPASALAPASLPVVPVAKKVQQGRNVTASEPRSAIPKAKVYTVQVFSSRVRKKAEIILDQLKQDGFQDAYIHTFIATNKSVLYRVRVGKGDRASMVSLSFRLQDLDFVETVQLTRI